MSLRLKPYPEYKDSGLTWLGEIPTHWQQSLLRRVARIQLSNVDKHTFDGEEPVRLCNYTDVYHQSYITPEIDFMRASAMPREISKFDLRRGDVLITKDSESWTDIAVPAYVTRDLPGVLCGYHLARIRPNLEVLNGEYLFRAFQAESIVYQFRVAATGVTRFALSGPDISSGLVPVPPLAEQDSIILFLNRLDRDINHLIRAKQRLIKLLNEQKQAIINRAVTRGLDPNVRLKLSGVDWIGDLPEHWAALPLKRVTTSIEQGWSPQCDAQPAGSHEWGVLKVGCVNGEVFDERQNKRLPDPLTPLPRLEIKDGDILVSRANTRGLVGLAASAERPRPRLMLCDKLFRFHALPQYAISRYLVLLIRSLSSRKQIEAAATGASSSMLNIGQNTISNLWISLPPLKEQQRIMEVISEETSQRNVIINRAKREIDLLREYRTRLVADIVTGKLEVRGLEIPAIEEVEELKEMDFAEEREPEALDESEEPAYADD